SIVAGSGRGSMRPRPARPAPSEDAMPEFGSGRRFHAPAGACSVLANPSVSRSNMMRASVPPVLAPAVLLLLLVPLPAAHAQDDAHAAAQGRAIVEKLCSRCHQ